ncbi:hypothetical protein V5F77_04990 [Xanthobacter sp. DSM 24535]|uniref:hypothetical protein n=1 Tax=Roseixanthobacter psychrophilus TaxID=3119917 RepID=UPI0037264530
MDFAEVDPAGTKLFRCYPAPLPIARDGIVSRHFSRPHAAIHAKGAPFRSAFSCRQMDAIIFSALTSLTKCVGLRSADEVSVRIEAASIMREAASYVFVGAKRRLRARLNRLPQCGELDFFRRL